MLRGKGGCGEDSPGVRKCKIVFFRKAELKRVRIRKQMHTLIILFQHRGNDSAVADRFTGAVTQASLFWTMS